jgi:hypothetical protein
LEVGELEALQLICYLLLAIRAQLPAGVAAIDYQVVPVKKLLASDVNYLMPLFVRAFFGCHRMGDTGVVENDIDAAVLLQHIVRQVSHIGRTGEITREKLDPRLFGHGFTLRAIDIGDHYPSPMLLHGFGGLKTYPSRASGDNGNPILQHRCRRVVHGG